MRKAILTILFFTIGFCTGHSQVIDYYYNPASIPLQKNFEQESFFGQPNTIIPNYYGSFSHILPDASYNPLLDLSLNPALIPEQEHYIYTDFSTRQTQENRRDFFPCAFCETIFTTNYTVYAQQNDTKNLAQPQVSLAYLARPFADTNIFLGVGYQGLYYTEDFYGVPTNSFRNMDGSMASFSDSNSVLPTSNRDNMSQTGHFFSLWTGYDYSAVSFGIKLNRSIFDRSGRTNQDFNYPVIDITPAPNYTSNQSRSQNYNHWDLMLGLAFDVTKKVSGGFAIGVVSSQIEQGINQNDHNLWLNESPDPQEEANFYTRRALTDSGWDITSETWYGNVHGSYEFNNNSKLNLVYCSSYLLNDLNLESVSEEEYLNEYRNTYQDTTTFSKSAGTYFESRTGNGDQDCRCQIIR